MTQTEVMTQTGQTTATIEHVIQNEEQVTSNEEQDAASFLEMLVESVSGTVSDSLPDSGIASHGQRNKDALFAQASDAYYAALRDKAVRLQDDPEFNMDDADTRFSTALNLRAVKQASCCIIGAGGLGNWQWRILLSMGFRQVIIYDDDTVGIENVGPQAHSIFDIGLPKVEAVRRAALQYRGLSIVARQKRVMTHADIADDLGFVPDIIIGCTDSAEFRNSFIHKLRESVMEHIRNGTGNTLISFRPRLSFFSGHATTRFGTAIAKPAVKGRSWYANFFSYPGKRDTQFHILTYTLEDLFRDALRTAEVLSGGLRGVDAFPLPLAYQRTLKFCECPQHLHHQPAHGVGGPLLFWGKPHVFLVEYYADPPVCQGVHELLQVEEIPGQAVYAVDVERIPLTQVPQASIQTGPVAAIAAKVIFEYLVEMYVGELPGRILVRRAHAYVSDVCAKCHAGYSCCRENTSWQRGGQDVLGAGGRKSPK